MFPESCGLLFQSVVTRDADSHEVLLLNIKETLSPLSEETPLVDDPAGATGDQDGAKDSVQKEDAEMPQLSQQVTTKKLHLAVSWLNHTDRYRPQFRN